MAFVLGYWPWNRKFESRLQQRNPMGMSIIKGDIQVGKKLTPVGMVYKQIAPVLTTLILSLTASAYAAFAANVIVFGLALSAETDATVPTT